MANPIAVPGTNVPSGAAVSPGGAQGAQGLTGTPAWTTCTSAFTVPAVGSTVLVPVVDTSWITTGEMLYVDQAGGTGQSGILQVTAKTSNSLTLLNPTPAPAIPPADATQAGLLKQLSGNTTDFVDGTNTCRNLVAALSALLVPTGTVLNFAGSTAPAGFVLCDGTSYATTGTYAALFAAIGYAFGGSGSNFNVPDCRGRTIVGVGLGAGLTNRTLASTGGEETHVLATGELAAHNHTININESPHNHGQTPHGHAVTDTGHTHPAPAATGGSYAIVAQAAGPNANLTAGGGQGSYASTTGSTSIASTLNITPISANIQAASTGITASSVNTGSGTGHNTMQPFISFNAIIKI